jgi:hypothetical protein
MRHYRRTRATCGVSDLVGHPGPMVGHRGSMGSSSSAPKPPPSLPVPQNKTRICIAGVTVSHHTGRARKIATYLAKTYPDKFETWFYFDGSDQYYAFLANKFESVPFPDHLKGHVGSPFVWLESSPNDVTPIGGRDHFCEYLQKNYASLVDSGTNEFKGWVTTGPSLLGDAFHNGKPELAMTAQTE